MGFFDSIRHSFNPEIQSTFDNLYTNYYKGLLDVCSTLHICLSRNMSYSDMKRIYEWRDIAIQKHNNILLEERIKKDRETITSLAKRYPHAFVVLCDKYLGGAIYDKNLRMPGSRKSSRQRAADAKKKNDPFLRLQAISALRESFHIYGKYNILGYQQYGYDRKIKPNGVTYTSQPHSVDDLIYTDVEKLLKHQNEFQTEENKILDILAKEDIEIKFDDDVLDVPWRAEYYERFLAANGRQKNDRKYVVENLDALSQFRKNEINKEYLRLKRLYPKGVEIYERDFSRDKEYIIKNEERISKFQVNAERYSSLKEWEKGQKEYAEYCRSINPKDFGCYVYDIPFDVISADGSAKKGTFRVWQHFCEAFYSETNTEVTKYLPFLETNSKKIITFIAKTSHFYNHVYDKVFDYIIKIREKFGSVTVVWGTSTLTDYKVFNDFHFGYLRSKLEEAQISNVYTADLNFPNISRYLVIIDVFTTNPWLKTFCEEIITKYPSLRPFITYISLSKCYDKDEIDKYITQTKEKLEKEEREKKEKNERKEKATSIVSLYPTGITKFFPNVNRYALSDTDCQNILNKESEIINYVNLMKRILHAVTSWDEVKGIPYYFFWYYYPTRFTDVSRDSEKARRIIWNFKDGIATDPSVATLVSSKLRSTFSASDLRQLTFVCILASTRDVNNDRYATFSEEVCSATGMRNGFSKITITKEKTPAHLSPTHESEPAEYAIEKNFFENSKVILFDDVVTRGHSMLRFKEMLSELGADIICAISIGRTYSDFFGDNRKPHPYTGNV